MADLTRRILDCDEDGEHGERGERGERGHRGHRGHDGNDGSTGPTGPTGPTAAATTLGGLLKFSGVIDVGVSGSPVVDYLTDWGVGHSFAAVISTPPSYPFAVARNVRNLSVNVLTAPAAGTSILVEVLRNGAPTSLSLTTSAIGVTSVAGLEPFAADETIDIRTTASTDLGLSVPVDISATVGLE